MKYNEAMNLSGTIVRQFEPFKELDKADLEAIAALMRVKYVKKGQYIISTCSENSDVYFLVSGRVRVCFFTQNGKQVHFDELVPGSMFGELAAIDNRGRSSDCISLVDCQVAILPQDDFNALVVQHTSVLESVLNRLTAMIRSNMRRVYEFAAYPVPQRVRFELLRLASEGSQSDSDGTIRIDNLPTHAEIASRISTHREAVNRELNSLIAQGVISSSQSSIFIHDVVALSDTQTD
ncbi:MAG: Crp/Fnr family transcriptional regulator [Granulosicoccus sp.]